MRQSNMILNFKWRSIQLFVQTKNDDIHLDMKV